MTVGLLLCLLQWWYGSSYSPTLAALHLCPDFLVLPSWCWFCALLCLDLLFKGLLGSSGVHSHCLR